MKNASILSLLLGLILFGCWTPSQAQTVPSYEKYIQAAKENYQSGKFETAAQYYEAALKLEPQSASAYQGIGNCYYKLGRVEEALKAFDESLALNPNNPKLANYVQGLHGSENAKTAPATDAQKKEISDEIDDIETEMFRPHWTAQLGLTSSGQPSQTGQGQITNELDFTGTDHLTEGGHYWAIGGGLGSQKVEGSQTGYAKATLEGGLGLGFFLPSLEFAYQRGQTQLNSPSLTATLDFQVFDPLTLGMSFNGTLESHNGPESIVGGSSGVTVEIDDGSWSSSLLCTFQAWDFLGFTLTGQQEYSVTYQVQGLRHQITEPVDEAEQINSISLMADWTFLKNFELQVTAQTGVENLPAGTVYSVIQAKTVTATQPSTENFNGYTIALLYNFD